MIDRQRLRNIIGSCEVEDVPDLTDNIAIALCTYFSAHMDRPDPDPESESGWGEWVTTKTNAALSLLASAVLKEVERTTNQPSAAQCRLEEKPCGDIWLHMTAPSGNKASLNLGHKPLDKLSFIDRVMLECATAPTPAPQPAVARIETQPGAPGFDGADVWNAQFDAADRARKAREDAEFEEGLRRQAEYMKSPEFKAVVDKARDAPRCTCPLVSWTLCDIHNPTSTPDPTDRC